MGGGASAGLMVTYDLSLRRTNSCWALPCRRRGDRDFPLLRSLMGDWALEDLRICRGGGKVRRSNMARPSHYHRRASA